MPGALEDVPDRVPDVPMSVVGRNSVQVDRAMIFAPRYAAVRGLRHGAQIICNPGRRRGRILRTHGARRGGNL